MNVRCPACGRLQPDDAEFCSDPDCGAFLQWEEPRPEAEDGSGPTTNRGIAREQATTYRPVRPATPAPPPTPVPPVPPDPAPPAPPPWTPPPPSPPRWTPPASTAPPSTPAGWTPPPAGPPSVPDAVTRATGPAWSPPPDPPERTSGPTPTPDLDVALTPQRAEGRGVTDHQLEIRNGGQRAVYVDLTSAVGDRILSLEHPTGTGVAPGQQAVTVRVEAETPIVGRPREIPFWLNVTPEGGTTTAATARGVRVVRPRLLLWQFIVLVAGVLVLLVVIGAALALAGGADEQVQVYPTTEPAPTSYVRPPAVGDGGGGSTRTRQTYRPVPPEWSTECCDTSSSEQTPEPSSEPEPEETGSP